MAEGSSLSKGPDAFRTISEVAEELDLPQHVLRFWETRFAQIRPMKRGGGRRYYRPDDVELLSGIRRLLYGEGYTIKGVQRILKEQGLRHVAAFGKDGRLDPPPAGIAADDDEAHFDIDEPEDERGAHRPASPTPAREGRREPVFEARPERSPSRPVERQPAPVARAAPEPVPNVSNFPAAPPDEPDSVDTYLPPLVAPAPAPAGRQAAGSTTADPYRPERGEAGRGTRDAAAHVPATARPPVAATHAPAPVSASSVSRDDIQALQAALVELLECKRLLDQSR